VNFQPTSATLPVSLEAPKLNAERPYECKIERKRQLFLRRSYGAETAHGGLVEVGGLRPRGRIVGLIAKAGVFSTLRRWQVSEKEVQLDGARSGFFFAPHSGLAEFSFCFLLKKSSF